MDNKDLKRLNGVYKQCIKVCEFQPTTKRFRNSVKNKIDNVCSRMTPKDN